MLCITQVAAPVQTSRNDGPVPCTRDQPVLLMDLVPASQSALLEYLADEGAPVEWTLDELIQLHFLLLDDCAKLADTGAPLEDKLELLQWIFTDPDKEDRPFSFANCLRLYGRSINPSQGSLAAREVREALLELTPRWMQESLANYPEWIRDAIRDNPPWIAEALSRNPQFINECIKKQSVTGDLFI
jgi:hypothetical protein